jgi:ABC-2 type transport system ATP-binding protein
MVAQAFLHKPGLVLIDEPLINLDPLMQRKIKDYLAGYVRDGGTVFISTHILGIAQEICTRIGIIHRGNLVREGTVAELKASSGSLEEVFLGAVRGDAHA